MSILIVQGDSKTKLMRFNISTVLLFIMTNMLQAQDHASALNTFFGTYVTDDGLVDYAKIDRSELAQISDLIAKANLDSWTETEQTAFYIDAYNFTVIHSVMERYPDFQSVESVSSFFKAPHKIAGASISLDALEKRLLTMYEKGSIHMVLNCGAMSCPPLLNKAFSAGDLASNINEAVEKALASRQIIGAGNNSISTIFQWYKSDFSPSVSSWLADRGTIVKEGYTHQKYDWSLNDKVSNSPKSQQEKSKINSINQVGIPDTRYYASNLYSKGSYEITSFNNYYVQTDGADGSEYQSDWFTSTWTALYGINKRLNIGLDFRIRATQMGVPEELSTFGGLAFPSALRTTNEDGETVKNTRSGLAAVGLRIKYQPIKEIRNLTFQHLIYVPTIGSGDAFLDWESMYILSDAYYDQTVGDKGAVFVSGGFHIENMNAAFFQSGDGYYQLSTPLTAIYSYFPTEKSTLYALANAAPRWGFNSQGGSTDAIWDPFYQLGAGFKYFITDDFQAEILYTKFYTNVELRTAATYNIGIRYYGW